MFFSLSSWENFFVFVDGDWCYFIRNLNTSVLVCLIMCILTESFKDDSWLPFVLLTCLEILFDLFFSLLLLRLSIRFTQFHTLLLCMHSLRGFSLSLIFWPEFTYKITISLIDLSLKISERRRSSKHSRQDWQNKKEQSNVIELTSIVVVVVSLMSEWEYPLQSSFWSHAITSDTNF